MYLFLNQSRILLLYGILSWEKMQMHAYCTLHLEYCILHICTMQDRETDAPMQSIMRWQRRRASLRFYLFSWYCRAKKHLLCLQISFKWRERCFDSIFYSVMASCCISSTADFLWNIEIWKIILIALEALEDLWNVKIGKMKPTVSHRSWDYVCLHAWLGSGPCAATCWWGSGGRI